MLLIAMSLPDLYIHLNLNLCSPKGGTGFGIKQLFLLTKRNMTVQTLSLKHTSTKGTVLVLLIDGQVPLPLVVHQPSLTSCHKTTTTSLTSPNITNTNLKTGLISSSQLCLVFLEFSIASNTSFNSSPHAHIIPLHISCPVPY